MAVSERLHRLLLTGRLRTINSGDLLQSSDSPTGVNLVIDGFVKRYMITNDGSIGVQNVYGPGDVFPLTLVFKALFNQSLYSGPEVFYYDAIHPATLRTLSAEELKESAENDHLIYRDLLIEAGKHLHASVNLIENLSLRSAYKRVAHELVYLARSFGKKQKDGIKIIIPLTQQDMADILSITRETVSMGMSELRKKGLIKGTRVLVIPDLTKLEEEAYS